MEENKKQAVEEVSDVTKQLDMWAEALGMSKEDLKNCKLKAIQELAEEESTESKCVSSCCGGCRCKEDARERVETGYAAINSLNNTIPYLSMLTTLIGSGLNHPAPQINLHLHLAK